MKKFFRISDEKMTTLAVYMDNKVSEEVHFRFAPCTNEEFVVQMFLRGVISKEIVEEVLDIDFEKIENGFLIVDTIKDFMHCNNAINSAKIDFPGRELYNEPSEKGKEYRFLLNWYCDCLNTLKKVIPEMEVLSDLQSDFPEIDCYFKSGHCFYTWKNVIL